MRRVRLCSRLTCLWRVLAGDAGVIVKRLMAGRFMTALDMAGVSLSLLPLDETRSDLAAHRCCVGCCNPTRVAGHRRIARLDAATGACAWPRTLSDPSIAPYGLVGCGVVRRAAADASRLPAPRLLPCSRPPRAMSARDAHAKVFSRPDVLTPQVRRAAVLQGSRHCLPHPPWRAVLAGRGVGGCDPRSL